MKPLSQFLFACLAGCVIALPVDAASGDLDPGFGIGGKVLTPIGTGDDRGNAIVMQGNGKLVVAGYSYNGSNNDFAVARYNADGTLDTDFNGTGKATIDFGSSDDIANGVALQSDGKIIIVGGSSSAGSNVFALARFHPNGTLDVSFGPSGTGKVKTTVASVSNLTQARSVKIQADDKILLAGQASSTASDFALVRYNQNGFLDTSFAAGGLAVADFAADNEYGYDVQLQADGRVLVVGYRTGFTGTGIAMVRYTTSGTLDTTFGGTGKITVSNSGVRFCYRAALQSDGKILLAGLSGGQDFALMRYTSAGVLDSTFGAAGVVITGIGTADDSAYDVSVQTDGKIVAAGFSYNGNTGLNDFALARYNSNGTLDTGFQGTGKLTTGFTGGSAIARAMVISPDGRIALAGYAHNGTKNNFAIARYFGSGSLIALVPVNGSQTNNARPTLSGQAAPNFSVNVYVDGNVIGTTVSDGAGLWSFTPASALADATHTMAVTETDSFGNTGPLSNTVSFTVDTAAPGPPIIATPAESTLVNSSWPVLSGIAEAGATVTIYLDNTATGASVAGAGGGWSFTPSVALANGLHTARATATDRAGNAGAFSSIVAFSTVAPLFGGPGGIDPSFGTGGRLLTSFGTGDDRGNAVAMQSDGKLVVAGYSYNGSNNDFAIARYNFDGTLDTTFNGTGKATTDFGSGDDIANGVALQSDGKIILVGRSLSAGISLFALVRYHPNGTLDTSFGPSGTGKIKTIIATSNSLPQARSVKIQPDGKILLAGQAYLSVSDFALLRYNSDGTLDNGFGTGGLVILDFAGDNEYGYDVVVQADARIVVVGYRDGNTGRGIAMARYNSNGTLDSTFGTSGKVLVSNSGIYFCYRAALQSDGKIVLAGVSFSQDFALMRYTSAGLIDITFGSAGVVSTGIGTADDVGYDVSVQNDGKILTAGYSYNANTGFNDFAVARYNINGTLDSGFQSTGKVTTSFTGGSAIGRALLIAPDGRIVVAGYAHNGVKNNFAVVRFFGTDQPPIVTTGAATGIVRNGAVLDGEVNPNSLATTARFEYGLTTSYGNMTGNLTLGNGHESVAVGSTISGLTDNTPYHYRLVATNAAGTTYGLDASFTTAPNPPLAFTGDAVNVSSTGANLVGVTIPNGRVTTAYFEFGLSAAYGAQTNSQLIPAEGTVVDVFAPLSGLVSGATYHFRLVAVNAGSPIPIVGVDKTFVANDPPPTVSTGGALLLSTTSARVFGTARVQSGSAQVFFDYGTAPDSFTASIAAIPATISANIDSAVSADITGLAQNVTYYYRIRAVSSGGPSAGTSTPLQVAVLSGLVQQSPTLVTPADRSGFLLVNLSPSTIGGAWRFRGEQQWRPSGVPVGGLPTGNWEVEFRPVPGWNQPLRRTESVVSGAPATLVDAQYYESGATATGALTVTITPESVATAPVLENRAQWRLSGEDDLEWQDTGTSRTALPAGQYLVEFKPIAGRTTPATLALFVQDATTSTAAAVYLLADAVVGDQPTVVPFETITANNGLPYGYLGQLRSSSGLASGFVVRPRVVLTAAHAVFDDAKLSAASLGTPVGTDAELAPFAADGLQWLFQRQNGTYEPKPQIPRGFYVLTGYAARRISDQSPGQSTPDSQNLDVAALYFNEDAGRGGFGGYLASDITENEWLKSNRQKILAGYPVDGVALSARGKMHTSLPGNVHFDLAYLRTFRTSDITSSGGASGGPLCVQYDDGKYYPAAVYLGGTAQTIVRAIDSSVIDLFDRAELSGNGGQNNTGGGITHTTVSTIAATTQPGGIKVIIEPAGARTAGARWGLSPDALDRASGNQQLNLDPKTYVLKLNTVNGYQAPTQQNVVVNGGQLKEVTFTYAALVAPNITSAGTKAGTRGVALTYNATATGSPAPAITLSGALPGGLTFTTSNDRISGTPTVAGVFAVTLRASNEAGEITKTLTLTVSPNLQDQLLSLNRNEPVNFQIVSSESGPGVVYAATGLPPGLALDSATGIITGALPNPASFSVPISVSNAGATANATLNITVDDGVLGLAARWTFDGNGNDVTGQDRNLTLVGNATTTTAKRQQGSRSLALDGNGDYAYTSAFELGTQFTIAAWVNIPANALNSQTIAANSGKVPTANGFRFFVNTASTTTSDGKLIFETGNGSVSLAVSTPIGAVAKDQWQHVAATVNRSAGTVTLYRNGIAVANGSIRTDFGNTAALYLGAMGGNVNPLRSNLDDARVYDHALSAVELASVVNGSNTAPTILAIADVTAAEGTVPELLGIISDPETAPQNLTLSAESSNPALLPSAAIALSGSGIYRGITITPAAGQIGTTTITVTVNDGTLAATTQFTLTVTGTPFATWRQQNFGTTAGINHTADNADPDGDGHSNIDEYAAGTDPNNTADAFQIAAFSRTGPGFSASANGKTDRTYELLRCTNLGLDDWTAVDSVGPLSSDGPVTLTDPASPAGSVFYKISVSVP